LGIAAPDVPSPPPPPPPIPLALPFPPLLRPDLGLLLRPWGHPGDAAALAGAWADPDVARWNPVPDARSEADAARWVAREGDRRDLGRAVDLVIAPPDHPEGVLGEVGLALADVERRWAEIGFWVLPSARGRGVASAAVVVFTNWALMDLPITRLFARTSPDNPAASRVVERAGYARAGKLGDGTLVWMRDETD